MHMLGAGLCWACSLLGAGQELSAVPAGRHACRSQIFHLLQNSLSTQPNGPSPYKKSNTLAMIYRTNHWLFDHVMHSCFDLCPLLEYSVLVVERLMFQEEHSSHHGRNDQSPCPQYDSF